MEKKQKELEKKQEMKKAQEANKGTKGGSPIRPNGSPKSK